MQNHPRNERTNGRTNKHGCSVLFWRRHGSIPRFRVSSPALSCTKRGNSKSSLVFNKPKTHSSDCEGYHCGFGACMAAIQPRFCVRGCAQTIAHNNEQGGNASGHLSHCIQVTRPRFPWRENSSRRNCLLGPRARPILSGRGQKGSAEIIGL